MIEKLYRSDGLTYNKIAEAVERLGADSFSGDSFIKQPDDADAELVRLMFEE